jgi:hypothetical protein
MQGGDGGCGFSRFPYAWRYPSHAEASTCRCWFSCGQMRGMSLEIISAYAAQRGARTR